MADFKDTLLLPFDKGLLSLPDEKAHWLMFNGQPLPETPSHSAALWRKILTCEQANRAAFNLLQHKNYTSHATLPAEQQDEQQQENTFDGALVLASRARAVNERNFIRAWNKTRKGGVVLCAGDKVSGIQPLRKWVGKHTAIAGHLSKHHALTFWAVKGDEPWPSPLSAPPSPYHIEAGMFSASGPDKGSQLLATYFDARIKGRIADFGAGWGYLSMEIEKKCPNIDTLNLFETDWHSLQAARKNVTHKHTSFHWVDLLHEAPKGPFHWVIMNPPFHSGRAAEPDIGKKFIETASRVLPSGGRLLMVANRNLPYEQTLRHFFKKMDIKAEDNGFKVIEAVK